MAKKEKIILAISVFLGILFGIFYVKTSIENAELKANFEENKEVLQIVGENKELEKSWKVLEAEILAKKDQKQEIENQIELLVKNKLEVEEKIHGNREKIIGKK